MRDCFITLDSIHFPNGTWPGVWRSNGLTYQLQMFMETYQTLVERSSSIITRSGSVAVAKQNRESTEGYSKSIVRKNNDKFGKGLVSTSRTYASPKGTGPSVLRSKRPLSACHTRRKCSMETTQNSVKGWVRYKLWSVGGCHCIWSGHRMSFNICERETSYCLSQQSHELM